MNMNEDSRIEEKLNESDPSGRNIDNILPQKLNILKFLIHIIVNVMVHLVVIPYFAIRCLFQYTTASIIGIIIFQIIYLFVIAEHYKLP